MKRAGIVTFQESANFGALLQAFALKKTVEKLGCRADIVNYHSAAKEEQYEIGLSSGKSMVGNLKSLLSYGIRKKRRRLFDGFRKEQLELTEKVYTRENLKQLNDIYDLFICGSDQVWNPMSIRHDATYFLDFADERKKCISYAPSIGVTLIPTEDRDMFIAGIKRMDRLSVREASGQKVIEEMTGRKAQVVLDPTLLQDEQEWRRIAKPVSTKGKYIFLYMVGYSGKAIRLARELSQKTGFPVYMPIKTVKDYKYRFHGFSGGPGEFVSMIMNAEYVITTSFHGTMFSVIFHKKFFVVDKPAANSATSSRIDDFLVMTGLDYRKYTDQKENLQDEINYSEADQVLNRMRDQSLEYLRESLEA